MFVLTFISLYALIYQKDPKKEKEKEKEIRNKKKKGKRKRKRKKLRLCVEVSLFYIGESVA
jgi:fucose permease